MSLRKLTGEEINRLIGKWRRRGRITREPIENFLGSVTNNKTPEDARENLLLDSHLYEWNFITFCAISEGIRIATGAN